MRRIISNDSYKLNHNTEKVFNAVADVTVYKDWWSKNVKVKVLESKDDFIGSRVEIRTSGGRFRCEVVSVKNPSEVRICYYDGVQTGEGIWTIIPEGEFGTLLTYSINLEPNGFIPRFLSNI